MSLPLLGLAVILLLVSGYGLYGRWLAGQFRLDDGAPTPAHRFNDGRDFVPTPRFYLFGQHFSAIAAAGPIAGPILACQVFGWLPCVLWIVLGVIFIGAVHDFSALVASVRYEALSVAGIVRRNLGERAWLAMMLFIWIALVYVIVAFTDITAGTFVGMTEEFEGGGFAFNPGGAVALSSLLYLGLAMVMGLVQRKLNVPLWILTLVFVPLTLISVWLGTQASTVLLFSQRTWSIAILAYCFAASLLPVWSLLQPRGYLGGFVLYMVLAVGVVGIFFGGYSIQQPAFKSWTGPNLTDALFPFLFVTIACGACSGFHGLVCSGTTSKQISKESHCRMVGYGGMLLEAFVALIALATVMVRAQGGSMPGPGKIYGDGMGRFLTVIIGEKHLLFATTFGAMAFSTFIFDTLDVATRLGRYILQEIVGWKSRASAAAATAATVLVPLGFVLSAGPGAYKTFWILFGTSNQLLAGLTLIGVTVWLKRAGRSYGFTLVPTAFVMGVTIWSLALQAGSALRAGAAGGLAWMNAGISVVLISLAAFLLFTSLRAPAQAVPAAVPRAG